MNDSEICFIIFTENDEGFEKCREHIKKLHMPDGMHIKYAKLQGERENALSLLQQCMNAVHSKYKVYLWQDTWILQEDFLLSAVTFFREHPDYGILGTCGTKIVDGAPKILGAVLSKNLRPLIYSNNNESCMEADMLSGILLMTQYDIPWRINLFSTSGSFAASQSLEFKRRGYHVGVFSQEKPWCKWNGDLGLLDSNGIDRQILSFEYGEDLAHGINPIWGSYNYHPEVEAQIDMAKHTLIKEDLSGQLPNAARRTMLLAKCFYDYNQKYTDDFLENQLSFLDSHWSKVYEGRNYDPDKRTVLFYDVFGQDTRGLAQIYLDAIGAIGYHILYVTYENPAKGKIPVLEALLNRYDAEIEYLPKYTNRFDGYKDICEVIYKHRPMFGFLYTWPQNVVSILAFMHFAGKMIRYQINLTDHAFWLGRNAFDYCLEFRDYGAAISAHCRRIPKEKLVYMPYYPAINKDIEFQGFPFEKNDDDFIIFSGGSLYKTIDKDGTYYRIVDRILEKHPQVKFWYAGSGEEDSYMKKLLDKWPGRAFFTPERKDLYSLMKHINMYLNTYPMGGGLMVQYSAAAGKVPMSLVKDDRMSGLLLNQESLGFIFHDEHDFLNAITRFIEDEPYRRSLESGMEASILTREEFRKRMVKLLQTPETYEYIPSLPNTSLFRREYFERFLADNKIEYFTAMKPPIHAMKPQIHVRKPLVKIH